MIAIRIKSDRLRACSFSAMRARCNSTVRKLMPRWAGDDLVGLARGHQLEDLAFARCQQSQPALQSGAFQTLFVGPIIPMQRSLDAF
jgi:hypothetical protein